MSEQITDFSRYEFKYVVNTRTARSFEDEIKNFMQYDSFIEELDEKKYPVRSLYFDNIGNSKFYEKIDGLKRREKYRLRTYSAHRDGFNDVFFEIKGKQNERTYKRRVKVEPAHIEFFENIDRCFELLDLYQGVDIIEGFVAAVQREKLLPRVLIDYDRRPYVSGFDTYFRITLDDNLKAMASHCLHDHNFGSQKKCIAGFKIIEVKFQRRVPRWFHRLIQTYEFRRQSISKYVVGMKTCDLAIDLS